MAKFKDLTGQTVGDFYVVERLENSKRGDARWKLRCTKCGAETVKYTTYLYKFDRHSCGKKYKTPDNRCSRCEYWRLLDNAHPRGMKCCHYILDTGMSRKRDGRNCYEFSERKNTDILKGEKL